MQKDWKNYFEYRDDGKLIWIARRQGAKLGGVAGSLKSDGYWRVHLDWRAYAVHRIVYEMHYGPIPPGMEVDHVDGDRANNKIENLRLATVPQNRMNRRKSKANTSGRKGVSWNKASKKWVAYIKAHGKRKHLGFFECLEEAHAAYRKAADEMHKEFARYD